MQDQVEEYDGLTKVVWTLSKLCHQYHQHQHYANMFQLSTCCMTMALTS